MCKPDVDGLASNIDGRRPDVDGRRPDVDGRTPDVDGVSRERIRSNFISIQKKKKQSFSN